MKGMYHRILMLTLLGWVLWCGLSAQGQRRPGFFNIEEITLLDSPFLQAQQLNFKTLLEFDTDRLLTPFVRQSGLSSTTDGNSPYYQWEYEHPAFTSFAWYPALAMDGHILGHYLSALSYAYAASHDDKQREAFKLRIDYIVKVLHDCQTAYDTDKTGMKGFIGGAPDNSIWTSLLDADYRTYNQRGNWVPFYCQHKVMAGLRDAYLYTGNTVAKESFKKMCDWVIQVVSMFSNDIMEMQILQWETGAMNEVLADAHQIFGEGKYMKAAQKFTHQIVIENMNGDAQHDFLDKKNCNELSALFVGCARISSLKREPRYVSSIHNYWEEVIGHRIMAIGGTGVGGYFVPKEKAASLINDADGPDLCTTVNLMKITQALFATEHLAKYPDYYERAMLNHVLSSIDPETGGFTYYTSMRPESYKIYSKVNESMWCCMGSGMESQSRYGEFIYSFDEDTLYVNLFIPSVLNSDKLSLRQESNYPYGQKSRITIQKKGNYQLAIRHPSWATDAFSIRVNGKPVRSKPVTGKASFVFCGRGWKEGDVVEVDYPMSLTFVTCPQNTEYIALRYGPSVLAAQTSSRTPGEPRYEALPKEYGGEGLHDFSPQSRAKFQNLAYAPMLICELQDVPKRVRLVDSTRLEFEVDASAVGSSWHTVAMRPFFCINHTRYSIYWNRQSETAWRRNPMFKDQLRKSELEALTFDELTPGEKNSEERHNLETSETGSHGSLNGRPFRDAQPDQWFEYTLDVSRADSICDAGQEVALVCIFSIGDKGRACNLSIDGQRFATYEISGIKPNGSGGKDKFYEQVFKVPNRYVRGKQNMKLRLSSADGSFVPRFYQIRFLKFDAELLNN